MSKDSVAITASASVLIDAYKHNEKYASTAEDADSTDRKGKYYCQRALNHSTMKLEGHQAASLVTSLPSSASSDVIHFYSGWDVQRLALIVAGGVVDDLNFGGEVLHDSDTSECSDQESDSDTEVNELLRAVPPEVLLHQRYETTATVDLLGNTNDTAFANMGYAKVYRNSVNENIPVSHAHHYAYRDLRLWRFNAYEFTRIFTVRPMTKTDRKWYDEVMGIQPQGIAPRIKGVRKCLRFLLQRPHPLHDSHVLVPRAKLGIPAFAGSPPPSNSESILLDSIMTRKRTRFARFFVSNFVPWSAAQPPVLCYSTWTNHVNTFEHEACLTRHREPDITEGTSREDHAAILSAKRSRKIAAGRLFDIENISKCFKVKRAAVVVSAKYRARARDFWSDNRVSKPPSIAPVENQRAARAIDALQARADRIFDGGDQAKRLLKLAKATKWAAELRSALLQSRFHSGILNTTPSRLKSVWAKAAYPTKQSLLGGVANPSAITALLKKPIVLQDSSEWNTSSSSIAINRTAIISGDEISVDKDPFAEITDDAYAIEAAQYIASGLPHDNAPLNPEQRACGRDIIKVAKLKKELAIQGLSPLRITGEIQRSGLHQISMMTGIYNYILVTSAYSTS